MSLIEVIAVLADINGGNCRIASWSEESTLDQVINLLVVDFPVGRDWAPGIKSSLELAFSGCHVFDYTEIGDFVNGQLSIEYIEFIVSHTTRK